MLLQIHEDMDNCEHLNQTTLGPGNSLHIKCLTAPCGGRGHPNTDALFYAHYNSVFKIKFCFSHESDLPIDEQILLNSEALTPCVALRPVLGPPWLCARLLFRITLQVWKFHQLVFFHCTVQPGLLPHSWSVNNQVVLEKTVDKSETSKKASLGLD